jgi:DNA-binding transcriptional LysR family regulator
MQNRMTDFDWTRARAFLATAEAGSYSEAGRLLGMAQSTVGRQVAALEDELGVVLFERVGNRMALTEAGEGLVAPVRAMREAADRVRLSAAGASQSMDGVVRITASDSLAALVLPPVLLQLRARHPGLHLHVVASNDVRDLVRREADIALRNVRPEQEELFARRLPSSDTWFYAARTYLDRHGRPATPADLGGQTFISWTPVEAYARAVASRGWPVSPDQFALASGNHVVQWELCKAGGGIGIMAGRVGDAEPRVERILPDEGPWPVPMWLVAHRELRTNARVRVVFDALADALGS